MGEIPDMPVLQPRPTVNCTIERKAKNQKRCSLAKQDTLWSSAMMPRATRENHPHAQ